MIVRGNKTYFDREDVLNIKQEDLPLIVLSRNYYSHFATEISVFDHTLWNHFMWMVHPGKFATQGVAFHEVPADQYLDGTYQLKFWSSKSWSAQSRILLQKQIEKELAEPWWKHRYDVLQILGIKLHLRMLQISWMQICSDWAEYIRTLDDEFRENSHRTPGEVDRWCLNQSHRGYDVFGRYYPLD